MRKLRKNNPMLEMARRCKRAGLPVETVTRGLKPENRQFVPQIEAEFNRFKPRKPA